MATTTQFLTMTTGLYSTHPNLPILPHATTIDPSSPFPVEGTVSAVQPVMYFAITLSKPALVVLRLQEGDTASRCAVFLSCNSPTPDANNAAWRLISPEPIKQMVLHPADPAYRVGVLHIAVQYLETSGQSSFQLHAKVLQKFFAMWMCTGEVRPRNASGSATAADKGAPAPSAKVAPSGGAGGRPGKLLNVEEAAAIYTGALHTSLVASAAQRGGAAEVPTGAPFTSLYIGDWKGYMRDGLGFQYYAAPEGVTPDNDDDVFDSELSSRCSSSGAGRGTKDRAVSKSVAPIAEVEAAQPLLLLRAFCERRNLPWSAWSIPDTLTPEELSLHGFGFHFDSTLCAGSSGSGDGGQRDGPATPSVSTVSRGRLDHTTTTALSAGPYFPACAESARSTVASPLTSPAKSHSTAADGIAALGMAIRALVISAISGAELDAWQVLPVQPGLEVYAGEWTANRKEGRGVYQWLDRSYVGDWVDGRREGYGLLRRQDGGWYRGQWERHVPHGQGVARLMPGDLLYEGEWCNGRRHGAGGLTYPDGMTVHGLWVDDMLQPQVHVVYRDGSMYDGLWEPQAGCRHGKGTWTDTQGCQHTHDWHLDVRVGPGREVYLNGVVLEGVWKEGQLIEGTYVFPNGDRHNGEMDPILHIREGTGTTVSADGRSVYTGEWHQDMRCGQGVQTLQKTKKATQAGAETTLIGTERYEGEWANDVRSGHGRLTDGDDVYEGEFARNCRDGVGLQRNIRTGSFYEGCWKGDHRCGPGSYHSATQSITYEGVFLLNRLTGLGMSTHNSTTERYEGTWLDGLRQGHGTLCLPNGDLLRGVWHRGESKPAATVEYIESTSPGESSSPAGRHVSRYVGGWHDGMRHGKGTQLFRDGSVYEGAWHLNRQHGRGRRTAASGESVECEWQDGLIVEGCDGKVHFVDGSVYRGQVNVAGVPHGAGILTYPDSTVFDGQFVDGIYHL